MVKKKDTAPQDEWHGPEELVFTGEKLAAYELEVVPMKDGKHVMDMGQTLESQPSPEPIAVDGTMVEPAADPQIDAEEDALDSTLDSLHLKLTSMGLTTAEVALLGVEEPGVRASRKAARRAKRVKPTGRGKANNSSSRTIKAV